MFPSKSKSKSVSKSKSSPLVHAQASQSKAGKQKKARPKTLLGHNERSPCPDGEDSRSNRIERGEVLEGEMQLRRSCVLQPRWSLSRRILPKKYGPEHWTYPPLRPGLKRHRVLGALRGRRSQSGWESQVGKAVRHRLRSGTALWGKCPRIFLAPRLRARI